MSDEEGTSSPKSPKHLADWSEAQFSEDEDAEITNAPGEKEAACAAEDERVSPCCHSLTMGEPVEHAMWLSKHIPRVQQMDCIFNMSRSFTSYCINSYDILDDNSRLNLLDAYMRMRHDTLALRLSGELSIGSETTDVRFCDVSPISSKKTPDFIVKVKDSLLIIEVTAVSNPERAYRKKGHMNKGYESKYNKEISELESLGIKCDYIVVVFDITNPDNKDHNEDISKCFQIIGNAIPPSALLNLDYIRREFITLTKYMLDTYSSLLSVLYGTPYSLPCYNDLSNVPIFGEPIKPFTGQYNRVGISNFLFDKIVSVTPRLAVMLEKASARMSENAGFLLCFEQVSANFRFKRVQTGAKVSEWIVAITNASYSWICTHLTVELKGNPVPLPKADFEFMSYDPALNATRSKVESTISLLPYSPDHNNGPVLLTSPMIDYSKKAKNIERMKLSCRFEDEGLERKLIESIIDFDSTSGSQDKFTHTMKSLSHPPLCSYEVNEASVDRAIKSYSAALKNVNTDAGEVTILHHVKQPFIYPIAQIQKSDYISYKCKPALLGLLTDVDLGDYTNKIIGVCKSKGFEFGSESNELNPIYEDAKRKLSDYHKEILSKLKELHRLQGGKFFPRMKDLPDADASHKKLSDLNAGLHKAAAASGVVNKNLAVITLGRGKKSQANADFKKEMGHFRPRDAKAHYKGVGLNYNPDILMSTMLLLKSALLAPSDATCPDPLYDEFVSTDAKLLMQMKEGMIRNNSSYYDHLRSTNLYHACSFISRLCHTLMFHSQSSLNSSRVVADNLGYDSVLLLIRGGKKIFSTKKTKLFRLIFPTFDVCSNLYSSNSIVCDFTVFRRGDRCYIATPWMNMHETVIADGITFLHRTMGFALLNRSPDIDCRSNMDRVFFNIILAIHNRRQTESMLHNLRYIFMNCLSEVSAIEEILPELAGFNYDYFQAWIRQCVLDNFKDFSMKLVDLHGESKGSKMPSLYNRDLRHPFNGHLITDFNTLALGIYSSYLMSKAPITQLLEQVKNMSGIMKNHDEFVNTKMSVENCMVSQGANDFVEYYESLSASDFNFDPSYCFLIGKFMGDYILNLENKSGLSTKWDNILNKPWDEMANTKGLRGDGDDFFGNKGYYIVYKDVLSNTDDFNRVMDVINSDLSGYDKERVINDANSTFKDRISSKELEGVVFHVVDKVQRGGSREIYVMDLETKVHQQVIEDYTKYLCKIIPNEMISIPSNKRLSSIHSKVFEGGKTDSEKYYWVLDCRKWAPKSIVEKFMIFLMGARHALPETFVIHALNFFSMMISKKVYTRPQVVDVLTKSKAGAKYKNYFKFDQKKKAYYFDMPYSWVMGIFNYFSSMMHVANQMHASHIIRITSQISFSSENILHMVAHSDDSAGKILVSNKHEMLRASFIYETLMHSANHLLSKKKCNQGKVYYEFLSILYIGDTLLSLLSKFTGIFNYHPTDKGYCSDITDAYSKCTELLLNGATFEQCYMALKIQTMLIYRFYFGTNLSKEYYNLPPGMFGIPDSHPLMVLLCGSDADVFRLMKAGDEFDKKLMLSLNEHLLPMTGEYTGLLKSFTCTPKVVLNNKLKRLSEGVQVGDEFMESWSLKNVSFHNTQLNAAQFISKMNDKAFIAALQDESLTRRLSRSYYFRSHLTVHTSLGDMLPREVRELIFLTRRAVKGETGDLKPEYKHVVDLVTDSCEIAVDATITDKLFEFIYCEVSRLYDYLDKIHFNEDSVVPNPKTCKPVYISVQKTTEECPVNYDSYSLCSWIKEPKYRAILPDTRGYMTAQTFIEKALATVALDVEVIKPEQLCTVLQKMKQRSKSEYFCYSNLPSDLREVNTYQDILNFLSHNTYSNKMIRGLAIQFAKTIGTPVECMTVDLSDPDLKAALSVFVMVNALAASPDFDLCMLDVDVHAPAYLGGGIMEMHVLVKKLIGYWRRHRVIFTHLQSLLVCVENNLAGKTSFSAELLRGTYFHSFINRQMLVENVWLGLGKMFISVGSSFLVLIITNIRVTSVLVQTLDETLDENQVTYMNICLSNAQLPKLQENMRQTEVEDWGLLGLCYDHYGVYYIGEVQGSLRHIPAKFDANLTTPLSNLDRGKVRSFRGSKMSWEATLDGQRHCYNISTLPIETQNAAVSLRGMLLDNIKNKRILSRFEGSAANIMVEICAKELDLERHIKPEMMMKNYIFTDLYKVIRACITRSLAKVLNPELTPKNIPAPDGGLLNILIQYSKYDPSFDFKWQRGISPEYVSLKASQPESFMTEILGTVKAKYDSLYTDIDKESIHRSLMKLSSCTTEEDMEAKMMSLLCTWGFLGVSGALEEMSGEKKIGGFNKIRNYDPDSVYITFFKDLFFEIFLPLMRIYGRGLMMDGFLPISAFGCNIPVNSKNINYYIMNLVHSIHLLTYNLGVVDFWTWDVNMEMLRAMISSVLTHSETAAEFAAVTSTKAATMNLPTTVESINEWKIAARTLMMLYVCCNCKSQELDFNVRRDLSTSTLNPYVLTRDTLATGGVKMKTMKLFHYGAISTQLYNNLSMDFREEYRGQTVWFKVDMVSNDVLNETGYLYYNHLAFPEKRYTSDFLNSDAFDEVNAEYQSAEPDLDYINEVVEGYKSDEGDPYEKREMKLVKVVLNGKLTNVLKVNLKIVILVGGSLTHENLSHIRMLGDEVLLVTNSAPLRVILNENFMCFRNRSTLWAGHSIANPKDLYYHMLSRSFADEAFWSRVLNADPVKKENIMPIVTGGYMVSRSNRGVLEDENEKSDPNNLWELLDKNLKAKEKDEEEDAAETSNTNLSMQGGAKFAKEDIEITKMKSEGLDDDQIAKYRKVREERNMKLTMEDLLARVTEMNKTGQVNEINSVMRDKVSSIITKPKSAAQHEMMMQAPLVFGGGRSKGKPRKNNLFRERKVIAEMESLCPGLIWKILSGTLYISSQTHEFLKNQIQSFKMMMGQAREHRHGKQFVLNLAMLILNDAVIVDEVDDDLITWRQLASTLLSLMLLDEGKADDVDWSFYDDEAEQGELRYGISGSAE